MNKTQTELFEAYRKANSARKLILLTRYGYDSHESYLKAMKVPFYKLKSKSTKVVTLVAPVKVKVTKKSSKTTSKTTDYVIAFDTTGSMNSYISSVKKHVVKLIGDLFDSSEGLLQVKIVAFGDYCDMRPLGNDKFGKAYQVIELTDNREALIKFVENAQGTSGGDGDEFYELVIKKINEETKWRDGHKAVLLIADDEPHKPGYSYGGITYQTKWEDEARKAKELGIQYDTLKIKKFVGWYSELSEITGGVSMDFQSASKMSDVIEGSVLARSSKSAYATKCSAVMDSGDSELIGAYKSMSTLSSLKD